MKQATKSMGYVYGELSQYLAPCFAWNLSQPAHVLRDVAILTYCNGDKLSGTLAKVFKMLLHLTDVGRSSSKGKK